jgi:hypothetical protein
MEQKSVIREIDSPPPFFSFAFHFRFFPRVIKRTIFPKKDPDQPHYYRGSGFSSITEYIVLFAAAIISLAVGLPGALGNGSLIGWSFSVAGAAGIIALLVMSSAAQNGYEPVFDDFRILTFLFCVFLGITCGLGLGHSLGSSYPVRILLAVTGMATGYVIGIIAGLWIQRLGWIAGLLDLLAGLCVISFIILDIIMLM